MISKTAAVEDLLAQLEERLYEVLKSKTDFDNYFGGRVHVSISTTKPLRMTVKEQEKPGPKLGSRFNISASRRVARRLEKLEEFDETE